MYSFEITLYILSFAKDSCRRNFRIFKFKFGRTTLYHDMIPRRKKQGKHLNANSFRGNSGFERKCGTQYVEKKRRQR